MSKTRNYDSDGYVVRAACVCVDAEERQVLLVSSRRDSRLWIVPGGGVEAGEETQEAALREVREEAGVCGHIIRTLGVFENPERRHRTSVYLLVVKELLQDWEEARDFGRRRQWFPLDKAAEELAKHKPLQCHYLDLLLLPTTTTTTTTATATTTRTIMMPTNTTTTTTASTTGTVMMPTTTTTATTTTGTVTMPTTTTTTTATTTATVMMPTATTTTVGISAATNHMCGCGSCSSCSSGGSGVVASLPNTTTTTTPLQSTLPQQLPPSPHHHCHHYHHYHHHHYYQQQPLQQPQHLPQQQPLLPSIDSQDT